MTRDVIAELRERPMSAAQIVIVIICIAMNMLDGYDVLAMSFSAPEVREHWGLAADQLGLLFSAGLFGMMGGALTISPFADMFGRRVVILGCLVVMTIGMWLSALSGSALELGIWRVVTGIGIGGMLASSATMAAEFSSLKARDIAVAFFTIGFGLGSITGGMITIQLMDAFDWRAVFWFGGAVSAFMLPVVFFLLPESLEFLMARRPGNVLNRVNGVLRKLKMDVLDAMPDLVPDENGKTGGKVPIFEVLSPALIVTTLLMCFVFGAVFFNNYFVASWTPTLIKDLGYSLEGGIWTTIINAGLGIVGSLSVGVLAPAIGMRIVAPLYMVLTAVAVLSFSFLTGPLVAIQAIFGAIGFFGHGAATCAYTIAPRIFPATSRVTGFGFAIGLGRLGGLSSPIILGMMIQADWSRPSYLVIMALPMIVGALVVVQLKALRGNSKMSASAGH